MILVLTRYQCAKEIDQEVQAAGPCWPPPVEPAPGFLGSEVFLDPRDSTQLYLVTRWSDSQAFEHWHKHQIPNSSVGNRSPDREPVPPAPGAPPAPPLACLEPVAGPRHFLDPESFLTGALSPAARFVVESPSLHLLVATLEGAVRFCNPTLANRLQIGAADLLSRHVWELLTDTDARSLRNLLACPARLPAERFLVNFVDAQHSPFTLECRLDVRPDQFLLLGEERKQTNVAGQEELLRLNNEMAVLTREHARRGRKLERALEESRTSHWHLKKIQEVLPICMECGKVKTGAHWEDVVTYLKENALFLSHGYCPDCLEHVKTQWGLPPEE